MATYNEKYYATIQRPNGSTVRLSVQKRNYSGYTFRMANVQQLALEIGGGNTPIYTPTIKTTARFSVVDAYDKGSTQYGESCVTVENGTKVKHGRWEEFYTNDPTLYRVQLSVGGSVIWTGFVTPDSWEESMVYRGSITVVARDMLGSLSDVSFENPTSGASDIDLGGLVNGAFSVCGAPMSCTLDVSNSLRNIANDTSIFAARFNNEAFADMSWWQALTSVLESLGMCIRYTGSNSFKCTSLRQIADASATLHNCEFINRSGVRTLDAPVRDVSGIYNLKYASAEVTPVKNSDLSVNGGISTYVYLSNNGSQGRSIIAVKKADIQTSVGSDWEPRHTMRPSILHKIALPADSSLVASGFTGFADMYFIANSGGDYGTTFFESIGEVSMEEGVLHAPMRLVIRQNGMLLTTDGSKMYQALGTGRNDEPGPQLATVEMYIKCDGMNGTTYHFNGDNWVTGNEKANELDADGLDPLVVTFENGEAVVDILPPSGITLRNASFQISITHVAVSGWLDANKPHNGVLVPLAFSIAEVEGSGLATKYSVVTKYNDDYNVRISRTPEFGSIDTVFPGRIFANIICDGSGNAVPNSWNWAGQSVGYPLEVMVQAQILQHYATALSIFTGTLHDKANDTAQPGLKYNYYNKSCILLRGTFDFATGFVKSAAIREFKTWSEVWGSSFNPTYVVKTTRQTGGSGGSSGGGGGGSVSGGTVTSVAMTVPTGMTVSGSPITTEGTLALGLATGYTIPTSANVTKGVTAYGWGNHANAGYLTSISSSDVTSALGFTPASTTDVNNLSEDVTVLQEKVGAIEDIIEELGDPRCLSAPKLQILRGFSHYNGASLTPKFVLSHPLIGKTGTQVVLMMWRRRRVRNPYRSLQRPNSRAGWGEARGPLATSTALVTNAGYSGQTHASVSLDDVRLWVLRRYLCSYEIPKANFATMQLSTFRSYDTTTRSFAFGQLFPADMPSAQRPTESAWKNRTKRWRQFGFAIRYENPKWTALELTNVAETTREVEDPQHQGRKIQRYIYSEVVPFKMFCLRGTKDARAQTDKWELGFEIGGVK